MARLPLFCLRKAWSTFEVALCLLMEFIVYFFHQTVFPLARAYALPRHAPHLLINHYKLPCGISKYVPPVVCWTYCALVLVCSGVTLLRCYSALFFRPQQCDF
ncbi:unnamed protein product, partial [Discosporangium mesarthrocarpum]